MSTSNVCLNPNIKTKLKFMNTNAQSLQFKIEALKLRIEEKGAKIVAVTETWGEEWKEATLEIENFNSFRKDRTDGRKGGGCIIYVSTDLKSYNCYELKNMAGDDSAWCWVTLTKKQRF